MIVNGRVQRIIHRNFSFGQRFFAFDGLQHDFLAEQGWEGDPQALGRDLDRLCSGPVQSINLDIGTGLGPRIGIEFHRSTSPLRDPRWKKFFDALEADRACTPEKRALVCAWPTSGDAGGRAGFRVERQLLVKAVHEPGRPLRAKAYLPFGARMAFG